jgi:hypothetical protein
VGPGDRCKAQDGLLERVMDASAASECRDTDAGWDANSNCGMQCRITWGSCVRTHRLFGRPDASSFEVEMTLV